MADVVLTIPKHLWRDWIRDEGDAWEYHLDANIAKPDIEPGERVYLVSHGRVRGYSPLGAPINYDGRGWVLSGRSDTAVAVTIPPTVQGFRGWRVRWWDRSEEIAFPEWKTAGVVF